LPLPLVERSKEEIAKAIRKKVEALRWVKGIRHLDVRVSGKRLDVDVHAFLDNGLTAEQTHSVALDIERVVKDKYPNARISIDTEPVGPGQNGVWKAVKDAAEETAGSRGVHNIHIQRIDGKLYVDLHLEVSANMTVKQAHDVAEQVENKIRVTKPEVSEVTVHIESASDRILRELSGVETELESYIQHVAKQFPEIKNVSRIGVRKAGGGIHLTLQCRFEPELSIEKAHEISNKLEKTIRTAYPKITRIDVHEEPA
jgi:divalent metal cation (Fe/Co/Zn/Cd) transporter